MRRDSVVCFPTIGLDSAFDRDSRHLEGVSRKVAPRYRLQRIAAPERDLAHPYQIPNGFQVCGSGVHRSR